MGRDSTLSAIEQELDAVVAGAFRVLLVTGPAGIGKTRLAAEAAARNRHRALGLSGRAFRLGATASFGVWAEALDRHLRRLPIDDLRRCCGPTAGVLATLVGAAERIAPLPEDPPDRSRLLEALVEVFDRLAAERPVLVSLDDVHLADSSSWEALRFLARRLAGAPIAILATARPPELSEHPAAPEVLVALDDDGALSRLALRPLGHGDVAELASDVLRSQRPARSSFVPAPLVGWLLERSRGHPLFVAGLLGALLEEGADLAAPRLERLPEALRDRVALELVDLGPEDRAVLEHLAVLDGRVELTTLQRVAGRSPAALARPLERLCRARLVAEVATDGDLAYEIVHPIVQETVYDAIGALSRRLAHRAAGRALLVAGHAGRAAGHLARAAGPGDAEAVTALCAAMRQAEDRGLHREALAILGALVDVLPAGDGRWRAVLDTMAWQSEWVLSHLAESDAATAVAAMERIESVTSPTTDEVAWGTVQFHLASFLSFGTGRFAEAEQACRRAVDAFGHAGDAHRVRLARNELAWIRGSAGALADQADAARAVLAEAEHAADLRAATQAAGAAAYALGLMGRSDESTTLFARSIELAERDANPYRVLWGRSQHAFFASLSGDLTGATATLESLTGAGTAATDALVLENLAHCHLLAGRLEEAASRAAEATADRPVLGSRRRAWVLALAARVDAEAGRAARARSRLDQAQATYRGQHLLAWGCWCPWTEGIVAWSAGEPRRALEELAAAADRLSAMGAAALEPVVVAELAEVAADAGEAAVAAGAARRLAELAGADGAPLTGALAELAAAWAHRPGAGAATDRRAAARAQRAAGRLGAAGYGLAAASALVARGRALSACDRTRAIASLEEAARAFEAMGAAWRRDRALALLARLGSRGRRVAAAVGGPAALTGRELEVARLAATGLTAAQIADRLYIGRRTVETHLAAVYAKLGVASKRELLSRAAELQLAPGADP